MRIDIVTLFPEFLRPYVEGSILRRAQHKGVVDIALHDLWDWVPEGERADDTPYGGGAGMVLRLGPIVDCLEELLGAGMPVPEGTRLVVPSPAGRQLRHALAEELASLDRLVVVCGRYEGIDERLFDLVRAQEVSIGDFVVTGGEIPALAIVDACVRLLPGAIAEESARDDSFANGKLDWPHFTRPPVFRGLAVPEILLGGDHARIAAWRRERASTRTAQRRPDLASGSDKTP